MNVNKFVVARLQLNASWQGQWLTIVTNRVLKWFIIWSRIFTIWTTVNDKRRYKVRWIYWYWLVIPVGILVPTKFNMDNFRINVVLEVADLDLIVRVSNIKFPLTLGIEPQVVDSDILDWILHTTLCTVVNSIIEPPVDSVDG